MTQGMDVEGGIPYLLTSLHEISTGNVRPDAHTVSLCCDLLCHQARSASGITGSQYHLCPALQMSSESLTPVAFSSHSR